MEWFHVSRRSKRVLVLNHSAVPKGIAGITRHAELFERLDGWEYLIVAGDLNRLTGERQPSEPGFLPIQIARYESNGLQRIGTWLQFAVKAFFRSLGLGRVDVVYASSPHLLTPVSGWAIAALRRAEFVMEVRDLWPRVLVDMGQLKESSPIHRILSIVETFLYARASRIVVMAEGVRNELRERGVPSEKLVYIPNGSDTADFAPSASREALREKYGFTTFTAVYAGAFGPANGLGLALDAADTLQGEDLEIVLVGGGVEKDKLTADAAARGLSNVRFVEAIPKHEVPDLLAAADIGLHVLADVELFRTGVSPNKLFDYMAAKLPVLTNSPGLCEDIVKSGNCGVAVHPLALADGIREMAARTRAADAVWNGSNGAAWIDANQSRTAMAHRLQETLDLVVAKRTRG